MARRIVLTIAALLIAGVSGGADRIEIIIDDSAAMWGALGGENARVVALREALANFALAVSLQDDDLKIGLRTMGGHHELIDDGPEDDYAACILAESGGPVTLAAPIVPGAYDIRYISNLGKILSRSTLEVFEVLATLDGPAEVSAGEEFEVTWTGPDASQDYLSIAEPGAANETYLEWAPTSEGDPLRLQAPRYTGEFELRYVRAADGEVLARHRMTVAAEAVSLRAPAEVDAGSRFEVEWSGTPGDGDFIVVAREGAVARKHFDWSYTTAGRSLTLAAPFRPGQYEVRYISGSEVKILARQPLVVR